MEKILLLRLAVVAAVVIKIVVIVYSNSILLHINSISYSTVIIKRMIKKETMVMIIIFLTKNTF